MQKNSLLYYNHQMSLIMILKEVKIMVIYPIGITLLIFIPIRTMGIKNQRRL